MSSVLLRDVTLAPGTSGQASAVLVTGGRITWTGPSTHTPAGPPGTAVIDAAGALCLPAFVDAHVHVTETGLFLDGADLSRVRSAAAILDAVAALAASRPGQPVIGHGWDEMLLAGERVPSAEELDRAAGGADVYLTRVDVHSALVSTGLAQRLRLATMDGWDATGRIERDAHHAARHATRFEISTGRRRTLQQNALAAAAAAGISEVHECGGPHLAPEQDLRDLMELSAAQAVPRVVPYWGELAASTEQARAIAERMLGRTGHQLAGLAGDLMVDGSFGSHTAAVHEDYCDRPGHRGHLYLDAPAIATHIQSCTEAGLQAGFHVIGDRAAQVVIDGLRRAATALGPGGGDTLRRARHRIEHLEGIAPSAFKTLAEFGVTAGVQPMFDAEWGGEGRMYEHRLGLARTRTLNPFAGLHAAGVPLAFGSDSPVTPFAPWEAIRAAMQHHTPEHRLSAGAAFRAHTSTPVDQGGRQRGRPGELHPGDVADLALWTATSLDDVLATLTRGGPVPDCVLAMRSGTVIHQI